MNLILEGISCLSEIITAKATVLLALATIALVVGAFLAGNYAKKNIGILKKRDRYDNYKNISP